MSKQFIVKIRREASRKVRPEAEQVDGKAYWFTCGWIMDHTDGYPGETAWIADDPAYPPNAPVWLASGDLIEVQK